MPPAPAWIWTKQFFGIVLAVEQGLELDLFARLFQIGQRAVGLVHRIGVAGFVAELVHGRDIVDAAQHRLDRLDSRLERFHFGDDALGGLLVVPEAGLRPFCLRVLFVRASLVGKSKRVPDGDDPG